MLAQLMGVYGLLFFAHVVFLVGNGRQEDGSGLKKYTDKLKHDAHFCHVFVYIRLIPVLI